jgi:uncharacterized protein YndB with AHSA1/START domain
MTAHRAAAPVVRLERRIPAPPAAVFTAFTDPVMLARWMSPVGRAEVAVDPRVGGRLLVAMIDGDVRIEHRGEFLELDPPRRLRFTWSSVHTSEVETMVTIELAPAGDGTRLILIHERLPTQAVASHAGGWGAMIDRLAGLLGSQPASEESR